MLFLIIRAAHLRELQVGGNDLTKIISIMHAGIKQQADTYLNPVTFNGRTKSAIIHDRLDAICTHPSGSKMNAKIARGYKSLHWIMMARLTNVTHLSVRWAFLEADVQGLKSLASLLDIVDSDGDVSKTPARVGVAGCISLEVGIALGAVVVREFQNTYVVI